MSKAEHLAPSGLQRLADARNSALIHKCEHGHPLCAMTFNGACAEEAAELYSLQQHMAPTSQPAPTIQETTPNADRCTAHQRPVVDARNTAPQLTLF